MDREQLDRLRHMNQDLLQRLKANQEKFKKRIPIKPQTPSLLSRNAVPKNRKVLDARNGKENQDQLPTDVPDTMTAVFEEGGTWVERSPRALGHPTKPSPSCNKPVRETQQQGHSCTDTPGGKLIFIPFASGGGAARETCRTVKNGSAPRSPRKPRPPSAHGEAKKCSVSLRGVPERERPKTAVELGQTQAKGSGRSKAQMLQTPKSILLTPRGKESKEKTKKETGRVTFMSDPEEYTIPADDWSVRPFLGYDWIAGLLDMDSSVSEKPDQYFSDLQDFRRVNKEACIYDRRPQSATSGPLTHEEESAVDLASHQCIFCYRLNKRLFTVPVDSEPACPVCKTPRDKQPPETLVEPAFVRVSIPRSTLLPAYKHKIHRRKSYEPVDNLALPTHCLAGWEHPVQPFSPTLSSLDLRSSLASKSPGPLYRNSMTQSWLGASSIPLRKRMLAMLLFFSYELWFVGYVSSASLWPGTGEIPFHWNSWEPWVCMCDLHKQARIRHFVAWVANVSRNMKVHEFWQERPCSLEDCNMCTFEECPDNAQRFAMFPRLQRLLLPPEPPTLKIPLAPRMGIPSYENLPVMDYASEN